MNTKLKSDFQNILEFENVQDKTEHDAKILMFKFLSIVEKEMQKRKMSKKDLARELNTSPSYVTQLFRGTKTINLIKLAELQTIFNIEFSINKAVPEKSTDHQRKNTSNKQYDFVN